MSPFLFFISRIHHPHPNPQHLFVFFESSQAIGFNNKKGNISIKSKILIKDVESVSCELEIWGYGQATYQQLYVFCNTARRENLRSHRGDSSVAYCCCLQVMKEKKLEKKFRQCTNSQKLSSNEHPLYCQFTEFAYLEDVDKLCPCNYWAEMHTVLFGI